METRHSVLITGGSRGIGLAIARRYVRAGARVMVTGRTATGLHRAAGEIEGLETFAGDVAQATSRAALATHIAQTMPEVDVVVNNAGIQRRVPLAADTAPWSERAEELQILLAGPVHLNSLLIPVLLAHGRRSMIVNVTSAGAFTPQPFAPIYSAAKAALHSYTMNLRFALRHTAIRVVELIPPAVATGLSGIEHPHGAPVEDFADTVFAQLAAGPDVVGYGPTDTQEFRAQLQQERVSFTTAAARFPIATYRQAPAGMSDAT